MKIETILTPAELPALAQRDLRATACVVFDVLQQQYLFHYARTKKVFVLKSKSRNSHAPMKIPQTAAATTSEK